MSSASSMVDWALAGRTARRLMSPGPQTTREDAASVVRELHEAAATAVAHVQELTGLRPVADGPVPEVVVVDRPGWVDANASGMAALLGELVDALAENLERHMPALDMGDDAGHAEHAAYERLAGRHRQIAAELRSVAEDMAGQSDLPMGRHDMDMIGSPEVAQSFARFIAAERELVAQLQRSLERDEALLREMRG